MSDKFAEQIRMDLAMSNETCQRLHEENQEKDKELASLRAELASCAQFKDWANTQLGADKDAFDEQQKRIAELESRLKEKEGFADFRDVVEHHRELSGVRYALEETRGSLAEARREVERLRAALQNIADMAEMGTMRGADFTLGQIQDATEKALQTPADETAAILADAKLSKQLLEAAPTIDGDLRAGKLPSFEDVTEEPNDGK